MKRLATLALLLAACATAPPAAPPDEKTLEQARSAIRQLEDAIAKNPTHMPWIYVLATYYDQVGDADNVVKWLTRLDELGWEHGAAPDAFRRTSTRAFRNIERRLEAKLPRVNRARVAFTLSGHRDLIPEGIAYDPVDDVFYVSSLYRRKVLRVDRSGRATDFVAEAQDGILGTLGMTVDAKRRLLWVVSAAGPEMRLKSEEGVAMLSAYDLRDGKLVKRLTNGTKEQPSFLNDLTLFENGTIFLTDTVRQNVVRLAPDANEFEVWVTDVLRFPNGITAAEDQRALYVADFRGVHRVELADKSIKRIEAAKLLNGIDGLTTHNGTLIGIQNAIGKARVVRIHLADNRVEILESKNELFEIPTTGVVARGEYYFIANPGLRSFDENGSLWPMEKLEEPVMLRIKL